MFLLHNTTRTSVTHQGALFILAGISWTRRQQVAKRYDDLFHHAREKSAPGLNGCGNPASSHLSNEDGNLITLYMKPRNASAWAQYTIQVEQRDTVQAKLKAAGIPTEVHYSIPLNRQPAVADVAAYLPIGDAVTGKVMSLPMHPYLDDAAIAVGVHTVAETAAVPA